MRVRIHEHLADASSLRDDRKDIGLALHAEVEHDDARVIPCVLDCLLDLLHAVDGHAAHAIRFGQLCEIGPGEWRAAIPASLQELLPFPHHAEVALVYDGYLDVREAFLP